MYDIPPGPSQVQVATWFISGVVKDWWTAKCAAREYGSLQTLDDFFQAVEDEFQPSDAPEQCMEKWCTLKHTHSVAMYMNEVDALHNTWRLCDKAEFGLALRGMKKELKGVIRRSLKDRKVKWVSLKELRELAVSAEVEKFDPPANRTAMFANYTKYAQRPVSKTHQTNLTVGAVELRNPKRNDIPATKSVQVWYMRYAQSPDIQMFEQEERRMLEVWG